MVLVWLATIALIAVAVLSPALRTAAIVGAAVVFFGGAYWKSKQESAAEADLFAALAAHVGRKHDEHWCTRRSTKSWWLVVWLPEKRFYFAKTNAPFNESHFYGEQDIRGWSIQRTREANGNRYWDEYAVNIVVKDTRNPLLKVHCGKNEAAAYKISEILNQMFECVNGVGQAETA